VVLLPDELLTSMPQPKERAQTVSTVPSLNPSGPEPAAAVSTTADGLPKRRRRRAMAIVPPSSETTGAPMTTGTPIRSEEETASIMGAFQRGTQSGRAALPEPAGRTSNAHDASSEGHEVS
jgi:hypothetical protein